MRKIIDRPVLASIFFCIVVLLGVYSLINTPIDLVPDPEEKLPSLTIEYYWIGASPDMMLRKVLIPAEGEIAQIRGVAGIDSRALQNHGRISVEFSRNTNMDFASVALSERLNRLQVELPRQVNRPSIQPYVPDDFKKLPFFNVGVYGDYTIFTLKKVVEREILPYLKSIQGIETIEVYGGVDPEIKIQTNIDKLKRFGISIGDIQARISSHFFSEKSLTMRKRGAEITFSLSESLERIEDLQNIVIRESGEKRVLLKEVADVFLGYQDINREQRYQGRPVIGLQMHKQASTSSLGLSRHIRQRLQQLADKLEGRVKFVVQNDDSKELQTRLMRLVRIAVLILLIIFVILIAIIRDVRSTILIFSSVFFSVFTTFTFIYLLKIPLNLLTLSGLALGFGLFVDNAVVVFDNILRRQEEGLSQKEAAVEGARGVFLPVLSSTITTIIVFFSFAYFDGRLRVYYLPLAWIIAVSLMSSVVVSFVLIPSLSARIRLKRRVKRAPLRKGKLFPFILRYPLVVILPVAVALFFSFSIFREKVSFGRFFSFYSKEQIRVYLSFPSDAEFANIKKDILKFEALALEKPYPKEVNTNIHMRGAYMQISFPPRIENSAIPYQLKKELVGLATQLAGVGVAVMGFDPENYHYNPDTGSFMPYSITLKGYHFERLILLADELKENLLKNRRIKDVEVQTDVEHWWGPSDQYYTFKLNRAKLQRFNLDPRYVLMLVYSVLRERSQSQYLKFEDKELSVEVKADDVDELELSDILELELSTPGGTPFRIRDLVEVEFHVQKGGITRQDQEYVAMVRWDYMGSNRAADRFHKTIYSNLQVPVGFKKSLEERKFRITEEEQKQLNFAIILSLVLIYLILGMLYEDLLQPLLIMLSIPLALIGVFIAFTLMDYAFDSTAYIGVILLGGIVVNNAILLIDNINHHLARSRRIVEAIAIATRERIRPIFMTSTTTVLGMLPMIIFKQADKNDIWSSLALCTVGGLTTSAILILFVLPVVYFLFLKLKQFVLEKGELTPPLEM